VSSGTGVNGTKICSAGVRAWTLRDGSGSHSCSRNYVKICRISCHLWKQTKCSVSQNFI